MVQKVQNEKIRKRLNLKNDVIFKTFFSRKGNEEFLIDFLEALLKIEITKIKIREEVDLEKLSEDEKGGRLDLQAELNNGIIVNIEMQIRDNHDMEQRTLLYGAKTISRATKRGTNYNNVKQVIMINILNYNMFGFDEYVSETVTVLEKHRDFQALRGIKWYFIELPKFRSTDPDMDNKINQWLAFIDDYDRGLVNMAEEKNETLKRARVEMDYLTGDEEVKRVAELREKWEMDFNSGISNAREEGKKEGKKEGKRIIAIKMLNKNIDIAEIVELTELSEKEVKEIRDKLKK